MTESERLEKELKIYNQGEYVGRWWMSCKSIGFMSTKKPNWIHRVLTNLILGWTWEDMK